jgi:fimbrial chaperone protein
LFHSFSKTRSRILSSHSAQHLTVANDFPTVTGTMANHHLTTTAWKIKTFMITVMTALVLSSQTVALAGSFKAIPVRLTIDAKSKTAVLKIVNEGEEKVTVQLEARSWEQDEHGNDIYGETNDIIFFPTMANIEKGETRIIRVGYNGKAGPQEKTYRLFMQELPVSKPGEMALKFALTLSIPVFISPEKEIKNWTAEASGLAEESLKVLVNNHGNSHIIVSKIKAVGLDESGAEVFSKEAAGWYNLAGKARLYPVGIQHEDCIKTKNIRVEATIEKTGKEFNLDVDKEMCTKKPEDPKDQLRVKATPQMESPSPSLPLARE